MGRGVEDGSKLGDEVLPSLVIAFRAFTADTGQGQILDVQRLEVRRDLAFPWVRIPEAVLDAAVESLGKGLFGELPLQNQNARLGFPEQALDQPSVALEEHFAVHDFTLQYSCELQ